MEEIVLKLDEAINQYNEKNSDKMTQARLGRLALPDLSASGQGYYISRWRKGRLDGLTAQRLYRLAKALNTTPNFLLNFEQ